MTQVYLQRHNDVTKHIKNQTVNTFSEIISTERKKDWLLIILIITICHKDLNVATENKYRPVILWNSSLTTDRNNKNLEWFKKTKSNGWQFWFPFASSKAIGLLLMASRCLFLATIFRISFRFNAVDDSSTRLHNTRSLTEHLFEHRKPIQNHSWTFLPSDGERHVSSLRHYVVTSRDYS